MADFPIACNLEGDYGYKVIVINDNDTVADVIRKTTELLVGILVAPFPHETTLKARVHGSKDALDDNAVVKDLGFVQMEALDIYVAT